MRTLNDTQFSILELVPVRDDKTIQFSLQHALELAQTAEKLGYRRMWLAEHHNMDGIASQQPLSCLAAYWQILKP